MPPILEPPSAPTQDRQSPFARRFVVTAIRFAIVLVIAALISGGWYLAKKGFGRKSRQLVAEELRKHGVEAKIGHLTLDPFRGLIARDVRIYDYKNRENSIALISEISLDINYGALLHRQEFLNAVDVRDAQLTLPLPGSKKKGEKPQLKHFHAHVDFPPEQIYVSQAEGLFCGVRLSATGQLIKRANYKAKPPLTEEEWQKRLSILRRVVTELQKFSYPRQHPSLQIKFNGDIADMENARVEATLRGERVRREQYELSDLLVTAEYADQRLNVNQFEWKDAAGAFSARADWARADGAANFRARSSIDLKSLLDAFGLGRLTTDATFQTPPNIEVSGTGQLGEERPQLKVIGHVGIDSFTYHAVPLTDLSADFSWDGERTLVRDLRVNQESGQLKADLLDAPDNLRLNIDSTISPVIAKGFISPEMQKFLDEWEWSKPPALHLEIRGPDHDPKSWQGDGTIALSRTRFRGAWLKNGESKIHFGDGAVSYDGFRVEREEGTATGNFTYDFKQHEVRLSNIKSSLNPAETIVWIDPKLLKTVTPYKFRQSPSITASGLYQFGGGKDTKIDINVDGARGMDYVFLGKTLPFDRVSGKLIFTQDHLKIVDLNGAIFSGSARGGADISLAHDDPRYHANITAEHIDFPRLTDLYYNFETSHGQLSGSYDFTGLGSDSRTMKGKGKLEVTNGDVFAIPIFGPLSGILGSLLPGTGYSIVRKATANFTIKDGTIHTEDFEAAGNLFSMLGHGDIHFLDDKLDFTVRMSANGPGLLLIPVYKLFEYVGEGSLKKPDWHPKRF
ncbi:MAG: AsmA-like C-terminal region-containing protein [Spartobacteria bacterium]